MFIQISWFGFCTASAIYGFTYDEYFDGRTSNSNIDYYRMEKTQLIDSFSLFLLGLVKKEKGGDVSPFFLLFLPKKLFFPQKKKKKKNFPPFSRRHNIYEI